MNLTNSDKTNLETDSKFYVFFLDYLSVIIFLGVVFIHLMSVVF